MLEAMFITDTDNKLFLANIPIITSVNIMRPFFIGSTYDEGKKWISVQSECKENPK